jgi:hypothetical protein
LAAATTELVSWIAIAHQPKSLGLNVTIPNTGNTNNAIEFRIKMTPKEIEVCFHLIE